MDDQQAIMPATDRGANVAHPTVGRIVHVWMRSGQAQPIAGIVVEVQDGPALPCTVNTFDPNGSKILVGVPHGEKYERGPRWSWPPRVG